MPNFTLMEASGTLDPFIGKFQAPIVSCIMETAEAFEETEICTKIFREVSSEHFAEGYTSLTAADDWEPTGENAAAPENGAEAGYSKIIENETWQSTFSISREFADDDNIGAARQMAKNFIKGYYRTRERFFARMLGEALQGNSEMKIAGRVFSLKSADGSNMFSKTHTPKISGKKQSNLYSDEFSADALFAGATAMQNLNGDNGEPLNMCPDTIIIPNIASLKQDVLAVLNSIQLPGTNNNDANPNRGVYNVIVDPYLNAYIGSISAPWLLMDSGFMQDNDCAIFQNRVPVEVTDRRERNKYHWDGYSRFSGGFVDFRGLMAFGIAGGSSLSGS